MNSSVVTKKILEIKSQGGTAVTFVGKKQMEEAETMTGWCCMGLQEYQRLVQELLGHDDWYITYLTCGHIVCPQNHMYLLHETNITPNQKCWLDRSIFYRMTVPEKSLRIPSWMVQWSLVVLFHSKYKWSKSCRWVISFIAWFTVTVSTCKWALTAFPQQYIQSGTAWIPPPI